MAKEFQLKDALGRPVCNLTKAEASNMRAQGKIEKCGRSSYRMISPPDPSNSRESAACLTGGNGIKGDGGDSMDLAGRHFEGGRISARKRERFIGWGLIPMPRYS
jgi:hypothetical protein